MGGFEVPWRQAPNAPEAMLFPISNFTSGSFFTEQAKNLRQVFDQRDVFAFGNATLGSPWSRKIWGNSTCVRQDGTVIIFNTDAPFLTKCFVTAAMSGLSLILLIPAFARIFELQRIQRGKRTVQGQISVVLGLIAPLLLLYTNSYESSPSPIIIFVGTFGLLVALLDYAQDGRVAVCVPELLFYWLGAIFGYSGWAIDSVIHNGARQSWNLLAAAGLSLTTFILQLYNTERKPQNRYDDTSIFARISISYTERLMKKHSTISHESLMDPPGHMCALTSNNELAAHLEKYPNDSKYRVVFALRDLLSIVMIKMIVLAIIGTCVSMTLPVVMGLFLSSLSKFTNGESPIYESYYLALLLGVIPIVSLSFDIMETVTANYLENKARASLMTVMYRKALRLSPGAREKIEPSKIMNMMSVDTQQVFMLASNLPNLVSMPLTLMIAIWQLWKFLGPSFLSAILVYLCVIPLSTKLSTTLGALLPDLMKFKDERNKFTTNAFRCIKSLKLHAWEQPFFERIRDLRFANELRLLHRKVYLSISMSVAWNTSGDLVAAAVFITYLYLKMGVLSPAIVFPSLVLLQSASGSILMFPQSLNSILTALNAQRRINDLLIQEDQDFKNYYRIRNEGAIGFEDNAIVVENAIASWNGEASDNKIALQKISFKATRGELVCIVGRVGAGKTALIKSLCGEMSILDGEISVKGTMAYCSQEAWLQNFTVRENIIFGQEFNEEWYNKVIEACELVSDIQQMPLGDGTEVGERGISLSGGQKARVAIARAVYSRADIMVFDDVLSAVDEHVGTALITKLFSSQGMLANRTIVLATNNVKVLSHSSLIIALEQKQMVESVSFKEVVSLGRRSLVHRLVEEFGHADDLKQEAEHIVERKNAIVERERANPSEFPPSLRDEPAAINYVDGRRQSDRKEEEEGEHNQVKSLSVFWRYLVGDQKFTFFFWLAILGLSTIITNGAIVYMGFITSHNLSSLYDARWYMSGYILINVLSAAFICLSHAYILIKIGLRNSQQFHDKMLWNVLHAPMKFFDTTPLGRLMNRFSGDISMLDDVMPTMFYYTLRSAINCLAVVGGIIIGSPIVIVAILPLAWLANKSRTMYVPMQRKVVRISSAANSPILSHIEDSLKGQSTIRAFNQTSEFIDVFDQRVDYWNKAAFYSANLSLWLGFRIQSLTTVLSLVSALAVTQLVGVGYLSTGYAAVILNFSQRAGVMVKQTIMFLAQVETSGVSLERLAEYIDIEQEAPAVIESTCPDKSWPKYGEIVFKDVYAKYTDDGPAVLKNICCHIKAGEKVGVVGRTGSGKSTLTMAIFRIIEAASGHIDMDGVDTSLLGLFDLRSRLSIIPQDAQIFDSSVRENLDPLRTTDDARLWEILDLCKLKDHFQSAQGLETQLNDSGSNLSRGQAQLLCLGRALVHQSKVLVLDEATASVDHETDRLVQETIRQNFSDRTIITIAHRLNTIMDSDRVIVLDHGEIKEFDSPQNLLAAKGIFYSLHNSEKIDDEIERNS